MSLDLSSVESSGTAILSRVMHAHATSFTDPFTEYYNEPMPTSALPSLVAPFWDDLSPLPEANSNVFWEMRGNAPDQELVIE